MFMRILIVEDQVETVKSIIEYCEEKNWPIETVGFDNFDDRLDIFMPDVIILDWKDGADNTKGDQVLDRIWANSFRPVIIFSGFADAIDLNEKNRTSNLVQVQPKGDEQPVIDYLEKIYPFVSVINTVKADFNNALIQALNSIEMMSKVPPINENVMRFIFAKRVSAYFDEECGDENPPAWIQYTYPAITKSLCVCDVIRSIPEKGDGMCQGQPQEYSVILTPSCDMAQSKVTHALCAKCYPKTAFHSYGTNSDPKEKYIDKLVTYLNTGHYNSLVSLPCIPNIAPYLTVNLKMLDFYPIEKIALQESEIEEHHQYYRIASIDSPFREQIVWAHMINSCRPGMPNRDMETWAKELMLP
jgi:CTP synthase